MVTAPRKRQQIAVDFGNVSIGDGTARIGIKIDRNDMELSEAEDTLCGRRITGSIKLVRTNEDPAQKPISGMEDDQHEIKGTFDVKAISVSPKRISAGLTFSLKSIPFEQLAFFAKRSGRLMVDNVAELEVEDEDNE